MNPITPTRRRPGPRRLEYIPPAFRDIAGVEHLTTRRQLSRLRDYLRLPVQDRPSFTRLGASVPAKGSGADCRPNATYAVCVDGEVTVVRVELDPRRAERWFAAGNRAWNLSREFAEAEVEQ